MAEEPIRLILHQDAPYVPFITSPDQPGLVISHPTIELLVEHLDHDLRELGIDGQPAFYTEFAGESWDGHTYRVRFLNDERVMERIEAVERLIDWIEDPEFNFDSKHLFPDKFGEYPFYAAVREDTLVAAQEGAEGWSAYSLVVMADDGWGVTLRQCVDPEQHPDSPEGMSFDLIEDLTVGELIDSAHTVDLFTGELISMPHTAVMAERLDRFARAGGHENAPLVRI